MTERYFSALKKSDPAALRAMCSAAGKKAHASGRAYRFTSEAAKAARKKNTRSHRWTPEEARIAGRKGGLAPKRRRLPQTPTQSLVKAAAYLAPAASA